MLTRYKELFRIRCKHAYFADGICHQLELRPTADCGRRLERNNCVFQKTAWGGIVHSDGRQPLSEPDPFIFVLVASKTQLASTTDIAPERMIYYFDNVGDEGRETIDGDAYQLLHRTGKPLRELPWRPPRFHYEAAASGSVKVFDAQNKLLVRSQTAYLDLSMLPEGHYQLKTAAAEPHEFYLAQTPPYSIWGLISIFPDVGSGRCGIVIPPRAAIWRYYIVSHSSEDRTYEGCNISLRPPKTVQSNGASTIEFMEPRPGILNGRRVWILESAAPIALHEYPAAHYFLILRQKGKDDGLPLAFADAGRTRLERKPDGTLTYCSEIYIYL